MMAAMTPLSDAWGPQFLFGGSGAGAGAGTPPSRSAAAAPRHQDPFKDGGGRRDGRRDPFSRSREAAVAKHAARSASAEIPFVDYNNEIADVRHYCKSFGVMCEKSPARILEHFDGMTEEDLNDVFVPIARSQVDASFSRLDEPPEPTPAPAPLPVMTPPDFLREAQHSLMGEPNVRSRDDGRGRPGVALPTLTDDGEPPVSIAKKQGGCASAVDWLGPLLSTSEALNLALFAIAGLLLIFALDQMVRIGIEISRARIGMAVALRNAAHVAQSI